MNSYRIYQINGGHIIRREEYDAPDDGSALLHALAGVESEAAEVWSGARKVGLVSGPAKQ